MKSGGRKFGSGNSSSIKKGKESPTRVKTKAGTMYGAKDHKEFLLKNESVLKSQLNLEIGSKVSNLR